MQRDSSNHQDSSIHGTVTSHDEEGSVSSVSSQVLRGRSRWWTSLTHLDRVMAARTPRQLPYIHIVRRDVNTSTKRARTVPPFPAKIMVADIHESERSVCAPTWVIHGIHSPVPAPYTCSYASSAPSSSSLPSIYFLLLHTFSVLSLSLSLIALVSLNVLPSFFRLQCDLRRKNARGECILCVIIGSFVLKESFLTIYRIFYKKWQKERDRELVKKYSKPFSNSLDRHDIWYFKLCVF